MKHTKIVATVSDIRCDIPFLKQLYCAGLNVVRMNTAHMDYDGISRIVDNVRTVSSSIGILMDTKGPEIRTTKCAETIQLTTGQKVMVKGIPSEQTTPECIYVSYDKMAVDVNVDDLILIDDGEIELKVTEKDSATGTLYCTSLNDGELGSRKSVNVPGVRINLPSLTEKDIRNIGYAIEKDIDFIAHSFVRSGRDILDIQDILDKHNSKIKIIAKIENQEGVENIDEILEYAYGVMIARGDLGIEVPQEKLPGIQRKLIRQCVKAKKPVIVATQMLHSMIKHPRPTRAEVTDIANAIYYRTDALMLSGETAYGDYPVEAINTMSKIAMEAELTKLADNDIRIPTKDDDRDVTAFISKQAVRAAVKLDCKAIITDSYTGNTARNLAAFRGKSPVYAQCYSERTMRELALSYGVFPQYFPAAENYREYLRDSISKLTKRNILKDEDVVAHVSGTTGVGGGTTMLELRTVESFLNK